MNAATTSTDWLARHPFDDAKYHLMPEKYVLKIKANPKSRLAWAEAKVRCNAQKRTMHARISPKRPMSDGGLPENMCQKCLTHI